MDFFLNHHCSFIHIGHALRKALDKAIPDQFKPVQQIWNHGFENCTACDIMDELFHTYACTSATDISKIGDTIKTPWDPNEPIEMLFNQVKDAPILALWENLGYDKQCLIMYVLNNITNTGIFEKTPWLLLPT